MKAYGAKRSHCTLPGHGTSCEVAREIRGSTLSRSTQRRRWQVEEQEEVEGDLSRVV